MAAPFANPTNTYRPSLADPLCPQCGRDLPASADPPSEAAEATRRIRELESQVRLLNSKAAAAVDKLADYEDEIRNLREVCARSQQQQGQVGSPPLEGTGPNIAYPAPGHAQPQQQQSRLASLSSFLPGRRKESTSTGALQPPLTPGTNTFPQHTPAHNPNTLSPPKPPFFSIGSGSSHSTPTLASEPQGTVTLVSLQSSLDEERTLRLRAESSLTQTQTELEELTAQLFGEANEMVANERKARAKLEERVKMLEQRDGDKRKRLEKLERQMQRIERVRGLVGD